MSDEESSPQRVAIGISFGNSNSSIAYTTSEGRAEVIANEEGDRQIPSMLSYVAGEEFQGTQAKAQLVRNPKNTVAYFRDFLGQEFKSIDPTPCHQSAHPREHESTVAFSIKDTESDDENVVTVSEITTRHLRRLKNSASDYLGKKVNAAVITVPTNFSDKQKEALSKAASGAGLEVLQFIHEPVAAVLAYDARPDAKLSDKIIVVADLGGIRSDVAVIASRGGMYSILATAHDYDLGGALLDQVVMDHFAKEFIKKHKTDPRQNDRSLAKLKLESEAVKKALSIGGSASFGVESLADGIDFTSIINRTRYELLANRHFASFTRLITHAVEKAELDVLDVDEIVLAGGTAHTPKIASNLRNAFPPTTTILAPSTSPTAINPSELAARGAAIQASLIQEYETEDIEQSTHPMVTVTPHLSASIGVLCISSDEGHGIFRPLIDAETPAPVRRTAQFATPREGGDVLVKICEGVREIKVTRAEKPVTNGKKEEEEDSEEDSEDEPEEVREKVWKVGKVLAEAAVKGVKKGGKVEVQVNVGPDLAVQVIAREVGGKGGVRGSIEKPAVVENGSA
ncbi:Hsp70 protein that interacts with Zuo1p [Coniosporium apollinis]|uniref:Hsp70 protein that interacts with Zuo1p n=1 Tax=Coniosporium apollinis TaxID=61459 RepID=A0ABQ9NKV8_9PEZI|nr:Hsp70 protein that interacts with Zuo1p [Coniosporium apollinis]